MSQDSFEGAKTWRKMEVVLVWGEEKRMLKGQISYLGSIKRKEREKKKDIHIL